MNLCLFFSLVFVLVIQCCLPEAAVPHISTGQISFSPFPASHTISLQQELCLIWALSRAHEVLPSRRSPDLLVWGPQQKLTEPQEAATRLCALLYPASERAHRCPVGLHPLGSTLLPAAGLQKRGLLAYPLKKEDRLGLPVQVLLHCSWPIPFRHLLC